MFKKITIFIFSFPVLLALFRAPSIFAYKLQVDEITPKIKTIPEFIKNVLDICIQIGVPISAFFMIWAGFLFLTAQGDPGKLKTAKQAFVWAVVGTAVVFCAWLLSVAIQNTIWQQIGGKPVPYTI